MAKKKDADKKAKKNKKDGEAKTEKKTSKKKDAAKKKKVRAEDANQFGLRERTTGGVATNVLLKASARKRQPGLTRSELVAGIDDAGLMRSGNRIDAENGADFWIKEKQQVEYGYTIVINENKKDPLNSRIVIVASPPTEETNAQFKEGRKLIVERKKSSGRPKKDKAEKDSGEKKDKKKGKKKKGKKKGKKSK